MFVLRYVFYFNSRRCQVAKRFSVNKRGSAKSFRKQSGRTKKLNVMAHPMRGGFRL